MEPHSELKKSNQPMNEFTQRSHNIPRMMCFSNKKRYIGSGEDVPFPHELTELMESRGYNKIL
jgi:hypothetical protein